MKISQLFLSLICAITIFGCSSDDVVRQSITVSPKITFLNSGTTEYLRGVYFEDMNTGYAMGDYGTLLKTVDGGVEWRKIPTKTTSTLYAYFVHNSLHYLCGQEFIGTGNSTETISSNQLKNYDTFASGSYANFVSSNGKVFCFGGSNAVYVKGYCIVPTSTGDKWEIPTFQYEADSIKYLGSFGKAIETEPGTILAPVTATENDNYGIFRINTQTYEVKTALRLVPKVQQILGMPDFAHCSVKALSKGDANTIVGINSYYGFITVSKDNGKTWSQQFLGENIRLFDIHMVSDLLGFACGFKGVLYYTGDGGDTWIPISSGTTNNLARLYFPSKTIGYAVGANGTIIKIDISQ